MKISFFLLFLMVSAIHLHACFTGNRKRMRQTKLFLMPLLAVCVFPLDSLPKLFLFLGVFCGFLGDAGLLGARRQGCFVFGLLSFGVGHVLYALAFLFTGERKDIFWGVYVLMALLYLASIFWFYRKLSPLFPNHFKILAVLYMILIYTISYFSVLHLIRMGSLAAAIMALGSLLFIVSDVILSFQLFQKKTPCGDFSVMSTYLAAQALIVSGFIWF